MCVCVYVYVCADHAPPALQGCSDQVGKVANLSHPTINATIDTTSYIAFTVTSDFPAPCVASARAICACNAKLTSASFAVCLHHACFYA